ncbi:aryl-alcohol dehydrogenase [Armillaria borealis]|uniref:Aryl-alcohol dehydrogenase n=1 Tax=Armillaria borealis TaxID=47425 RepID=A0AA39JTI5_9AGAR|nr:aryl-alcohol dehydrogenase [Armillaria borealis]
MSVVTLGSSKLKVSKIILGCALYGSPDWLSRVQNEEESIKQIKAAYDAGINTFDMSNVYSNEQSEVVLGKAIKQETLPRDGIVVMTKVFHPVSRNMDERIDGKATEYADTHRYANQYSLTREHIFDSIKKSLERLQLDYIDVLHCQEYDTNTPTHETVRAFVKAKQTSMTADLTCPPGTSTSLSFDHSLVTSSHMKALHDAVQAGWVRYVGMSNCRAWQFHVMQNHAIVNHLTPFISMQNDYNLLYREDENEMLPTLKYLDVPFIPLTSLVHGAMTMPLDQQLALPSDNMFPGGRKEWHNTIITRVEEIALQKNVTMTQVAIAWSWGRECVRALVINASTTGQLLDAIRGVDVLLTPVEIQYLEEPYIPQKLRH